MLEGTKLYSILFNKCPKCQQGDVFINKSPYKKGFINMHAKCAHCGEAFEKEVGFYYGAMYVSYGVNIAYGVGLFLLAVLLFKIDLIMYLLLFFGLVVVLFPWTIRISRLIYLNLFVKFDSSKK
jgi:uncharacterized protein (DUF983 family)